MIKETICLLNSMILGGEDHSAQSEGMVNSALAAIQTLPSSKQIGEMVEVDFGVSGTIYGRIDAVRFTQSSVLYDIEIPVEIDDMGKVQDATIIVAVESSFVKTRRELQMTKTCQDQLKQLMTATWDGDLMSKTDRTALVELGFIARHNGYNFITEKGIQAALDLKLIHK